MAETSDGVKVQYTGPGDVRKISKKDFGTLELEHEAAEWNRENGHTTSLSQGAADLLVKRFPEEFKLAK